MRDPLPFQSSERLVYEAEFSRSLLRGINVAEFRFQVEDAPATDAARPNTSRANTPQPEAAPPAELILKCEAVSKGFFNKLFGLDFRFAFESLVRRDSLFLLRSRKHDEQGDRLRTSEALFDHTARRVVWTESDPKEPGKAPRVIETPFGDAANAPHDLASVFYHLRTRPLAPGSSFDLLLSDSGRVYRVPVAVTGTKRLDTILGKQNTIELDLALFGTDRLVEGRGQMTLWFTNDTRRIPLRARISSDAGTLNIKLKRYEQASKRA